MEVPLVLQDQAPEESYRQIAASLQALQQTSALIFGRVQAAVDERRGRLDELQARLQTVEGKLEALGGSSQPLVAEASALFAELDVLKTWHPLFPRPPPGAASLPSAAGQGPPPPLPSGDDGGRVHGRDTADLFHFFNQAGALAPSVSSKGAPVTPPAGLKAATSLLRYGTSQPAYGSADAEPAPKAPTSLALQKSAHQGRQQGRAREPHGCEEDLAVPALSLPDALPSLEQVAAASQRSSRSEHSRGHSEAALGGRMPGVASSAQASPQAAASPWQQNAAQALSAAYGDATASAAGLGRAAVPQQGAEESAVPASPRQRSQQFQHRRAFQPPPGLPRSRGGSAEGLDAQQQQPPSAAVPTQAAAEEGAGPSSFGSQKRFGFADSTLDKQVDLGALGHVATDLEHSIMLRQRSLSSRTSLEDAGTSEHLRLFGN